MLDGRIYRLSLIIPALALLVLAFSLSPQPRALHASLPPTGFNGSSVSATMVALQTSAPDRAPGSPADDRVATRFASALAGDGFAVSNDEFSARTVDGQRVLRNVIASRAGSQTGRGVVVVVAPRDLPGLAGASPTAMLMALGRVLGGETLKRGLVLASVSGSSGAVGASRLAATLPGPIDAVLVLGDVASRPTGAPVLLPWGSSAAIAPVRLRNTVAAALAAQTSIHAAPVHVLSQLAHLAFPLTLAGQGPFIAHGEPAVELSLSGERGPRANAPVLGPGRLAGVGEGVLSAVTAVAAGPAIPSASSDVLFDGEIVPGWAISLFVLALILPVVLVTIDGLARARRRRYPLGHALGAVLAATVPFLSAGAVLLIARALGTLRAPSGAVGPGAVPLTAGAIAAIVLAVLAAVASGLVTRRAFADLGAARTDGFERATRGRPHAHPQDAVAVVALAVLAVVAVLLWIADPLAAALVVPALHLWLWALDPDLGLPAGGWIRPVMLALGAVPTAAVVVFYADSLGFGVGQLAYEAILLLAGHGVSWLAAVEWALVLGCLVSGIVLLVSAARRPQAAVAPVTVRGPVGYAGPGSLGGTKSALRR